MHTTDPVSATAARLAADTAEALSHLTAVCDGLASPRPDCGHSPCVQHWIDTGASECTHPVARLEASVEALTQALVYSGQQYEVLADVARALVHYLDQTCDFCTETGESPFTGASVWLARLRSALDGGPVYPPLLRHEVPPEPEDEAVGAEVRR